MIADKEEIHIGQVIVHILDSTVGMPVLSDKVLDYGSDFADFLKAHIFRIDTSDEIRPHILHPYDKCGPLGQQQ